MAEPYRFVYDGKEAEIIEKKSRFIATVFSVETEEEAEAYLEQTKKKYWDARHNCYAYVIGTKGEKQRCSDDGEPQGTAGRPMLDVLIGEAICNVLVIVTRYFGGTLLGTGGLVRAYSQATKEGLAKSEILWNCPAQNIFIQTDYTGLGKIQYIAHQMDLKIKDTVYTEQVVINVLVPAENYHELEQKVMEATSATATLIDEGVEWYATSNNKQ